MIFNDVIYIYSEGYTEHTDARCGPNACLSRKQIFRVVVSCGWIITSSRLKERTFFVFQGSGL